jgi:hypothetical protein
MLLNDRSTEVYLFADGFNENGISCASAASGLHTHVSTESESDSLPELHYGHEYE